MWKVSLGHPDRLEEEESIGITGRGALSVCVCYRVSSSPVWKESYPRGNTNAEERMGQCRSSFADALHQWVGILLFL